MSLPSETFPDYPVYTHQLHHSRFLYPAFFVLNPLITVINNKPVHGFRAPRLANGPLPYHRGRHQLALNLCSRPLGDRVWGGYPLHPPGAQSRIWKHTCSLKLHCLSGWILQNGMRGRSLKSMSLYLNFSNHVKLQDFCRRLFRNKIRVTHNWVILHGRLVIIGNFKTLIWIISRSFGVGIF